MTPETSLFAHAAAALVLAVIAGVFLAFSDFVMRSLRAASPLAGIEAMQLINRKVYRSVFLVALLGMAPVTALLAAHAWLALDRAAAGWAIAGGLLYVVGTFGVTMLGNVPMNQRLDPMAMDAPATRAYWGSYLQGWTRWNHVRTMASFAAAGCFLAASLSAG